MSGRLSSLPDMRQQCSGRVNGAVALRSVFPIATKPFPLHAACNRWPETIPEIDNRTASRTTMRRTVDLYWRADFEQPQPDCSALRLLHPGSAQAEASHFVHQATGHARQVQPQLIRLQAVSRSPIREQLQLLLPGSILHHW